MDRKKITAALDTNSVLAIRAGEEDSPNISSSFRQFLPMSRQGSRQNGTPRQNILIFI
jgi:hypothetical protein